MGQNRGILMVLARSGWVVETPAAFGCRFTLFSYLTRIARRDASQPRREEGEVF
jgi:hypothetical protein